MSSYQPRMRLRFSLSHLAVLVAGIAVGFAPLQWWRSRQPPPVFSVTVHIADVPVPKLAELGLPDSDSLAHATFSSIDNLLGTLKQLKSTDSHLKFWSITFPVTKGQTPRWKNGGTIDLPSLANDGSVAITERYYGDIISVSPEELQNGKILLTFDITTQQLDYSSKVMAGDIEVFPQFTRSLKSQVVVFDGEFFAIPVGKRPDQNGVIRELIYILSATKTEN